MQMTDYIRDIQYDNHEQRVFVEYGNGVTNNYVYNNETRRLENLFSESVNQGITLQKNSYKYDAVGNITHIQGDGINNFSHDYAYDPAYRLEKALGEGSWQGNNLNYAQYLEYSPAGRILNKRTNSQRISNQLGLYNEDYDNKYSYELDENPYGVNHIIDNNTGDEHYFGWDKKGNMTFHNDKSIDNSRYLCWTEDNRMQAVKDNNMAAYYGYDAQGERSLKLTGGVISSTQNGVPYNYAFLDSPTLYASGLVTINDKGYTKHYFEEGKRICSKIGSGELRETDALVEPIEMDYSEQINRQIEGVYQTYERCINITPPSRWICTPPRHYYKDL